MGRAGRDGHELGWAGLASERPRSGI
eukprot:COSAG06_NODE_43341_length_373_cov_0.470803_2_plen_25_part_01